MIALLCPSRGRPEALAEMVSSAITLAAQPDDLQFYFRFDRDDVTAHEALRLLAHIGDGLKQVSCFGERGRGYLDLPVFYNDLARMACDGALGEKADILGLLNDDCVFVQQGWDTTITQALGQLHEQLDDGIGLALGDPFAFVFITRAWYEAVGYVCHDGEVHVDTYLGEIARTIGRCVPVPMIMEHRRLDDETTQDVQRAAWAAQTPHLYGSPEHQAWREETARKLNDVLQRYRP